jgi:drug/metabolite transporter (DMT)-like permease
VLAAFLTTILFSVSAVCGNRTAKLLGGTEANFWRLCLATVVLALFAHGFGGGLASSAFPLFLVSGCVGFGVGDMALFQALPRLGSRLSVLLTLCLSSPIAALIEWAWLGTGLSLAEILCGLLILVGVAVALAPGKDFKIGSRELRWGLSFGLLAAFCQALGAVLSRKAFAVAMAAGEDVDGVTAATNASWRGRVRSGLPAGETSRHQRNAADPTGETTAAFEHRRGRWRKAWPWVIANGLPARRLA